MLPTVRLQGFPTFVVFGILPLQFATAMPVATVAKMVREQALTVYGGS